MRRVYGGDPVRLVRPRTPRSGAGGWSRPSSSPPGRAPMSLLSLSTTRSTSGNVTCPQLFGPSCVGASYNSVRYILRCIPCSINVPRLDRSTGVADLQQLDGDRALEPGEQRSCCHVPTDCSCHQTDNNISRHIEVGTFRNPDVQARQMDKCRAHGIDYVSLQSYGSCARRSVISRHRRRAF